MKLQNLMFTFMVVLLSASLLNTGNVNAVPNTNFETGDYFHYDSNEIRSGLRQDTFVLGNTTDPNQIFRYQEHINEDYETVEGDLDLFLIKEGTNLPDFTGPDGAFDHVMIVDWDGVTVAPSNRTWLDNFLDGGDPSCQTWCNSTKQVEDTTGRHQSNDDDDESWMPVVSNSTYLFQLSEMTDDTYGVDTRDWQKDGELDLGSFDSQIPLTTRTVTTEGGRLYNINGVDHNIDTRIVFSEFEVTHVETFSTSIPFGDSNDQSSYIDVNATVDIYARFTFTQYFDFSTGALLEMQDDTHFGLDLSHSNTSMANQGGGPTPLKLDTKFIIEQKRTNSMVIDEASSFYGNPRPTSTDPNRIEEGDYLVYESENEQEWSFDSNMIVGDSSTTGWESYDSNWAWGDSYGTVGFDVYRHEPGSWDTVMVMESTGEGERGYDSSGTRQGQPYNDANTTTQGPEDGLEFDYMSFLSTADEEIVHFFDDNQHFDDDFLYDDGDGWRLEYERDLPKSGVVNDSTWHIDLPTDEVFQINGFDRTWFDVQMYGQDYSRTYNQVVEIPVAREDDWEIWMNVTLTGEAEGFQDWFYDANTGALIRMEQRTKVHLVLDGNQMINIQVHEEGMEPATISVSADFNAEIFIEEKFAIMLSEHPVEYLTAEAADPVDHSTDTSSSTTTTTSTTSTSSSSESSNGDDGGLPIPIPIVPVFFALSLITLVVRKRKY